MPQIILNFHGVGPVPRSLDEGERECWLEQDAFEAVLDLARGQPHVRLTLDDGNASDCEIALPALRRRGLQATFFVCTGRLGQPTFLSPAQVRELLSQGMGIGSHGVAHVSWRRLSPQQLREEVAGSRRVLEELCGVPVDTAACPFGSYDRRVLEDLRQARYRAVYTSDCGSARETDWLRARNTVTRSTPLGDIAQLIRQGPGALQQSLINVRKLIKRLRL